MPALLSYISYQPLVDVQLGPLKVSPHGVGIAVGFLLGARLMLPTARRKGIDEEDVISVLMWAALGALVGARLAYVINHAGEYTDVVSALKVWEGGISLLGGIFGAIALAMPQMKKRGMDFWTTMDAAAPGMALGIVIGRVGDLVVGDHLGKPTSFFLGYECPDVRSASPCLGPVVHQTALYDLLLTSVLLGVLLLLRRRERYTGFLIIFFGAWYGAGRIVEDFLREDLRHFGLTGSQWSAAVTLTVCIGWLLLVRRTPRWGHWSLAAEAGTHEPSSEGATDSEPGSGDTGRTEPPSATPSMSAPLEADGFDREE